MIRELTRIFAKRDEVVSRKAAKWRLKGAGEKGMSDHEWTRIRTNAEFFRPNSVIGDTGTNRITKIKDKKLRRSSTQRR